MLKPTTIIIPDFITDYLRENIKSTVRRIESTCARQGDDFPERFHPDSLRGLQGFYMRPVVGGVDETTFNRLAVFHAEFKPFEKGENPQISCHMIGHVRWNAEMKEELASVKWRFNLNSEEQTNAYITYL